MPRRSSSRYVPVDELLSEVTLEQVAAYYDLELPKLHRTSRDTRTRCFLVCGRSEETGDRALAIQEQHPAKQWRCHQYGCGKGGNLVGLCDLLKSGTHMDGRPRGARFKEIAADLQAMVRGEIAQTMPESTPLRQKQVVDPTEEAPNMPLAVAPNERARALVDLDQQFVTDPASMPLAGASYFRQRPFLTQETCAAWHVGYLPQNAKTMLRGKIVYAYHDAEGRLLTWFGRDPRFEEKHKAWKEAGREGREPIKTQFVKGFKRGQELYGAHTVLRLPESATSRNVGLVIVEGPNDAIRLQVLGVPAVALCANSITEEQATLAAGLADKVADGTISLMLDTDEEGERQIPQTLSKLAEHTPVRLLWSRAMHGQKFLGRQPEDISDEEWGMLRVALTKS